jgi:flagella basal body P-ring formation protein FlgA
MRLLRRYCDGAGIEKSSLTIIVSEQQRHYVSPDFDGATVLAFPAVEVRQAVMGLVRCSKDEGLIQLLSYGRDVLELDREDKRIRSLSFGRYRQMSYLSSEQQRSGAAPSIPPVVADNVAEKAPDVAVPVQAEPPVEEPKRPVYRSEVFQEILIKRNLGPFPDHRPLVYNAVEKLIGAGVKVRVSELLQRAVSDAKVAAAERNKAAGKEPRVDDRLWAAIAKFSEQLFLEAKVLIGPEGEALGTGWKSRSLPVHSLAPNWRAMCDGLLVLGLIDEGEAISSVEAKNISRAIYHSSSEESETRVNDAVLHLLASEILEEGPEGLRRIQRTNEARMAPRLVS